MVLFDLLVNILGHNLAEPAYEAEVAQLEYKLVAGEHGLVIKVKGFNHKLHVSERLRRPLDPKMKTKSTSDVKSLPRDETFLHLHLSKLSTEVNSHVASRKKNQNPSVLFPGASPETTATPATNLKSSFF